MVPPLSPETVAEIRRLLADGVRKAEIARRLKLDRTTVHKYATRDAVARPPARLEPEPVATTLEEEKAKTLRASRVLTYVPRSRIAGIDSLAGYDNLVDWVRARKLSFTPAARAEGLPYPRGLILLGVPGSGKSCCAKALARELDMPLIIMDYAAVKGSLVGESENRLKDTLAQVRAIKRSVLLLDS